MTEPTSSPRVLVADDDRDFRENILPEALDRIGAETVLAENVLEACMAVADHSRPGNSLDLIVLDMHMPLHKDTTKIAADGGIQVLYSYRLVTCPVVVFTAYPSYQNCVLATQAGAAAYLPKGTQDTYDGTEGGIDQLIDTCQRLLQKPESQATTSPLGPDWLQANHDWLKREYGGRWVAFTDAAKARSAQITGEERGGLLVVSEKSKEDLARFIITKLPLLGEVPTPLFVQEKD